jgi:hypothetical protein
MNREQNKKTSRTTLMFFYYCVQHTTCTTTTICIYFEHNFNTFAQHLFFIKKQFTIYIYIYRGINLIA